MQNYYKDHDKFYVAIDCIIFGFDEGQLKLLILKRDFEPAKDDFSLIGGFVNIDESTDDAAARILNKLTGLSDIYMEQLQGFGEVERDPGERTVSLAYFALVKIQDIDPLHVENNGAQWCPIKDLPSLIFDHHLMVDKAMRRLRRRSGNQPLGFELLPRKFTLPQLQKLYESIFQTEFDNRNFRKKVLDMNILQKMDEKDKSSSKKGAFYYRFDKRKYDKLVKDGFLFNL
ncbi:MAG: NUDIX hydrolase [Deltaproteobacteria bacterium]|nr:NUDIX hydrolase [Deltaproteobacteria bacterium]